MKKILLVAVLAVFSMNNANAQAKTKKAVTTKTEVQKLDGATIIFENEVIDYGNIAHNSDGQREFVFTNTGNKPLVIENTQGSCGCTVPSKPEKPIQPGEKGVIGVKYATDRVGPFTKTITVTTNAVGSNVTPVTTPSANGGAAVATGKSTKIITIKGNVLPSAPAAPVVETKS